MTDVDSFLEHYGVKGMKWGVEKEQYKAAGHQGRKEIKKAYDAKVIAAREKTAPQREALQKRQNELVITDLGLQSKWAKQPNNSMYDTDAMEKWVTSQPEYKAASTRFKTAATKYNKMPDRDLAEALTSAQVREGRIAAGVALGVMGAFTVAYVALLANS